MSLPKVIKRKTKKVVKLQSAGFRVYLQISEVKSNAQFIDEPFDEPSDVSDKTVRFIKIRTEAYRKAVYDDGPYYWYITLTFGVKASFEQVCKLVNSYLRKHNIKLFKTGYQNRENQWLTGYAFFENHPMENSINEWHVHMLVKPNARFNDFTYTQNKDIFKKAAADVLYKKKRVFFKDHIDIQNAYDGVVDDYSVKQTNDTCLTSIKMFGKSGLSDSLRPVKTYYMEGLYAEINK